MKSKPKKPKRTNQPIVIDTADTSSQDLGGGYKLSFQRSINRGTKVRAIIRDEKGAICIRGDMTEASDAFSSRLSALHKLQERNYNRSMGLPDNATKKDQLAKIEEMIKTMFPGMPT